MGGLAEEDDGSAGSRFERAGSAGSSSSFGTANDCLRLFFFLPPRWFRRFLLAADSEMVTEAAVEWVAVKAWVGRCGPTEDVESALTGVAAVLELEDAIVDRC